MTTACIYFKEGNDNFRTCFSALSEKILKAMAGKTELSGPSLRSRARIHFRKCTGSFRASEQGVSRKILEALASGDSIGIVTFENEVHRTRNFKYDLKRMKLISLTTEETEDILIEFQWHSKSLISIVGNGDKKLKRQLLMMALDRVRTRASLTKALSNKQLRRYVLRENPYLFPSHPPYKNFIDSLYNFLEEKTRSHRSMVESTLFEKFLNCASEDATRDTFAAIEEENIRFVFHGTDPAVMDGILFTGLKPEYRRQGANSDFFSLDYDYSFRFTIQRMIQNPASPMPPYGTKASTLLFMVINPTLEDISDLMSVSVHSNKCELALGMMNYIISAE